MSTSKAETTLREVTQETLGAVLNLEVRDDQKRFVASNAKSIAQAHFYEQLWFRAIYAGDTPVGFVMLYIDEETPAHKISRFMIDKEHQGKGYGRQALRLVIEHVRGLPGATKLELSHQPGEGNPAPFYAQAGFVHTGEEWHGEKVMRLEF
jgi:diamine N-acetyltransferase